MSDNFASKLEFLIRLLMFGTSFVSLAVVVATLVILDILLLTLFKIRIVEGGEGAGAGPPKISLPVFLLKLLQTYELVPKTF